MQFKKVVSFLGGKAARAQS